jgi:NAD(P)-dependent dehydrogenase (short-subunit alcohol dehydrogenase family)
MSVAPALLVLGATGAIGRGVVRAALDAGRPVIAVSPDRDGLRDLQGSHAHAALSILVARPRDERSAASLVRAIRKLGRPIDGVVATLCTERERGRLLDQPADDLREALDTHVVAHLALARHLLPLLAEGGRSGGYVLIDGPGGEHPWAGYGHRSVGAAALQMLARVLHDEARALSVRLQMVSLDWPVRTDANAKHACDQWPSANGIGRRVLKLIDRKDPTATDAIVRCTGPCSDDAPQADAPQTTDSDASLLTSRCLQDARTLLGSISSTSASPAADSHLLHKEDTHEPPTRR